MYNQQVIQENMILIDDVTMGIITISYIAKNQFVSNILVWNDVIWNHIAKKVEKMNYQHNICKLVQLS